MDNTALLAHILTQTRHNVDFLVAQKQISQDVANEILSKLPKPGSSVDVLVKNTEKLAVSTPSSTSNPASSQGSYPSTPYQPPSATGALSAPASAPTLPHGVIFRAKALWDYNERGENPADLSFRGGEIIYVIAETNADWWTGRHNDKEGIFPANYVQRVTFAPTASPAPNAHPSAPIPAAQAAYSPPAVSSPPYGAAPGYSSYTPPAAPGGYGPPSVYTPPSGYAPPAGYAPTGGYTGPPPPGQAYAPYASQAGYAPGSSDYNNNNNNTEGKDKDKKKHKMGGLGETFATAAVGGVGFGAGSAIGSGIIDSIF